MASSVRISHFLGVGKPKPEGETSRVDVIVNTSGVLKGSKKRSYAAITVEQQQAMAEGRAAKVREARKKIYVGVDFGTTFSGIAWMTLDAGRPDAEIVHRWPGSKDSILEQVPTRVAYKVDNPDLDEDKFGYEIPPSAVTCQWFKLGLDGSFRSSKYDDKSLFAGLDSAHFRLPAGKEYKDVATDFFGYLYRQACAAIEQRLGKASANETPKQFSITVPASWSYAAREATRQAAQDAGFGSKEMDSIVLTDEPESAAVCTMKTTISGFRGPTPFVKGTVVTFVDMGGGTVDLITYKIMGVDPLKLEEIVVGEGAKIGGTSIDRAFLKLLKERFGMSFTKLPGKKCLPGSLFFERFEDAKRAFNPDVSMNQIELPLKMHKLDLDNPNIQKWYDSEEDMVRLTCDELQEMFDDVLRPTFALVREQIARAKDLKKRVNALVLCGGLGASMYVERQFKRFIVHELGSEIDLLQPDKPWSSICRGAALRGEKSSVLFRRSRDFIGVVVHTKFDENLHDEADALEDEVLGEKRAGNQMHWLVKRGDKISSGTKNRLSVFTVVPGNHIGETLEHEETLYSCSSNKAPTTLRSARVKTLGKIVIDLTQVVAKERRRLVKSRSVSQDLTIPFDIVLSTGADKGVLQVTAQLGKTVVGSSCIEYAADPGWRKNVIRGGTKRR